MIDKLREALKNDETEKIEVIEKKCREKIRVEIQRRVGEQFKIPQVVLQGCHFYTKVSGNRQQEIDFLLLSADRRLIIAIESKRTWNRKAIDQLVKYGRL